MNRDSRGCAHDVRAYKIMHVGANRVLREAFRDQTPLTGVHGGLYKYPARFSPLFARAAISELTEPDDVVLDPFVGGGTTAVEALALGRRALVADISPVACLVTRARTTPLGPKEAADLLSWAHHLRVDRRRTLPDDPRVDGLPCELAAYLVPALDDVALLSSRVRTAARSVLLRLGQWVLEGSERETYRHLRTDLWSQKAVEFTVALLSSLQHLIEGAESHGVSRNEIHTRRRVLCVSAEQLTEKVRELASCALLLTSPPYPGVHVLYHRWQVDGRRETPALFWVSNTRDGSGPAFYTLGGRHAAGIEAYFGRLRRTFERMRLLLAPDAKVVQVVSFNRTSTLLPRYRASMLAAGYEAIHSRALRRRVPGRRWYARARDTDAGSEYLLVFRKGTARAQG